VLQRPLTRSTSPIQASTDLLTAGTSQALAKNANNYKAMFRKGKALGEQGFFEKAVKILEEVQEKNPTG
jgi:Flp pilus assembly protein TadD